jgi:hypothetical protein
MPNQAARLDRVRQHPRQDTPSSPAPSAASRQKRASRPQENRSGPRSSA